MMQYYNEINMKTYSSKSGNWLYRNPKAKSEDKKRIITIITAFEVDKLLLLATISESVIN